MNMQWIVAKYISDQRRREPVNVGVLLFSEGQAFTRFVGQREDGKVDKRYIKFARSAEIYKSWLDHWRRSAIAEKSAPSLLARCARRPDDSYFLEPAGERLVANEPAQDPESVLDDLYSILVEQPAPETLSVSRLSETVLNRLDIASKVIRKFELYVGGNELLFDYRYDNSAPCLMQRVSLSLGDDRSWSNVYAASLTFEKAASDAATATLGSKAKRIALIKPRTSDANFGRQLGMLQEYADHVVDVSQEEYASAALGELLHTGSA